ncbi:MAG: NAD-dependent epimerase/dehydratase family protein [Psychromonas sp.]
MKVLVTGGFGFIGAHLVETLIENGHSVRILDNKKKPSILDTWIEKMLQNKPLKIMIGDIRDMDTCTKACEGIETVFHTAGIASIPVSFQEPQMTYDINVTATENLLKACIGANVKKFIYSSSAKLYGNSKDGLYKETDPINPTTPYAVTKAAAEKLCQRYASLSELNIISLRYFSVYGPRQSLFGGFISDILGNVFNGGPLKIHANENMQRDFAYIDDVVQSNILSLNYDVSGFEAFNIGSGEQYNVPRLVKSIEKISNKTINISYLPLLEGTTVKTCADIQKAHDILGYQPKTSLDQGLRQTFSYFEQEQQLQAITNKNRKVTAVILTGGSGSRVTESKEPKQFLQIAGQPLFTHALLTYSAMQEVDEICLVVNQKFLPKYKEILSDYDIKKLKYIVPGGKYRHESIRNALKEINQNGIVILHNGASPTTSPELICRCIESAKVKGAVSAFVSASHTVFIKDNQQIRNVLEREKTGYTCDPQVFHSELLAKAIQFSEKLDYGRDMPMVELVNCLGNPVHLEESSRDNLKVTTSSDIKAIEYVLQKKRGNL